MDCLITANRKEATMNKLRPSLLLIALLIHVLVIAQPNNPEITIFKAYDPKLPDVQKIMEIPEITDSVQTKPDIRYELNSRRIPTQFEIDPIKAANVKGEPLNKLNRGYARAGFGSYSSPYGELFYHNLRSRKYALGMHYRHFSSSGQIVERGYSGFSENALNLSGKSFIKKSTLTGGFQYKRDVVHYYGFNPEDTYWLPFELNRENTRQRYQLVGMNVKLNDHYPVDSQAVKFGGEMNYYNFQELSGSRENVFGIGGGASFFFKGYDLKALLSLNYFDNQFTNGNQTDLYLTFRPQIRFTQDLWRLKAGLATFGASDSSGGFRIAPELDFDLHLYKDIIIFNLGTESNFKRFNLRELAAENPFIVADPELGTSWSMFNIYAGFRGALSSRTSFNIRASYVKIENQAFFVNDTLAGGIHKFQTIYDDASLFEAKGEITHIMNEKIRLYARAHYRGYTPDVELRAWHIPALQMHYGVSYKIADKIEADIAIITRSRQFARSLVLVDTLGIPQYEALELKGYADINLGIEYHYTKQLGMFLRINNLLNVRYERFYRYPIQRFNLHGGISYSFK